MVSQNAVHCLELADSYLEEVEGAITRVEGDESSSYRLLGTLDLAIKQIDKAEQIDPNTTLNEVDIPHFRAVAIAHRGFIENIGLGKRSKAISSLKKSIEICEDIPAPYYALGIIYSQMGNKGDALTHLRRAVELAPELIEYRKALDRLENISGAGLKLGAFHGSWKVLLVLAGIFVLGLLIVGDSAQGGIFLMLVSLVIGFIYWMLKSR